MSLRDVFIIKLWKLLWEYLVVKNTVQKPRVISEIRRSWVPSLFLFWILFFAVDTFNFESVYFYFGFCFLQLILLILNQYLSSNYHTKVEFLKNRSKTYQWNFWGLSKKYEVSDKVFYISLYYTNIDWEQWYHHNRPVCKQIICYLKKYLQWLCKKLFS